MLATPIKQKLEKQVKARCRSGFEPENCWTVERHNTADHRHTTGSRSWLCGELWHLDMGPESRAKTISDYLDSGQLPDMRLFPLQSENVIMWFAAWFHWSPDCLEWNAQLNRCYSRQVKFSLSLFAEQNLLHAVCEPVGVHRPLPHLCG